MKSCVPLTWTEIIQVTWRVKLRWCWWLFLKCHMQRAESVRHFHTDTDRQTDRQTDIQRDSREHQRERERESERSVSTLITWRRRWTHVTLTGIRLPAVSWTLTLTLTLRLLRTTTLMQWRRLRWSFADRTLWVDVALANVISCTHTHTHTRTYGTQRSALIVSSHAWTHLYSLY